MHNDSDEIIEDEDEQLDFIDEYMREMDMKAAR